MAALAKNSAECEQVRQTTKPWECMGSRCGRWEAVVTDKDRQLCSQRNQGLNHNLLLTSPGHWLSYLTFLNRIIFISECPDQYVPYLPRSVCSGYLMFDRHTPSFQSQGSSFLWGAIFLPHPICFWWGCEFWMQQAHDLGLANHVPNTPATVTSHEWVQHLRCSDHRTISSSCARAALCFGWTQRL